MKIILFVYLFIVILSCSLITKSSDAISIGEALTNPSAQPSLISNTVEGYADPSFKELYQTFIMFGGMDINKPEVIDNYIRLIYCNTYKDNYSNDYMWNKISKRIAKRVLDKKEGYRILYQVVERFELERYDFGREFFPFSKKTSMLNVISMTLSDFKSFIPYCGLKVPSAPFIPVVNILLFKPITINKIRVPAENIKKMIVKMNLSDNNKKNIYARIRFRVIDAPGVYYHNERAVRSEIRGEIKSIDFFYDNNLTKKIPNIKGYF